MVNTQRNEHEQAMTSLLRTTLGQTVDRAALETAKQHVAGCPVCWARFGELVEALTGAPVPAWAEDNDSASISVAPTFGEQWRLQHYAPGIEHRPGHWQRGAGYLARLTQEFEGYTAALLISTRQFLAGQDLAPAHRGAVPEPFGPSALLRTGSARDAPVKGLAEGPHRGITLRGPELPDLEATVTLDPDAADPDLVRVAVEISIPSRWPDFSGVRVILDDGERKREQVTGRAGRVEFGAVPVEKASDLNLIVLSPRAVGREEMQVATG